MRNASVAMVVALLAFAPNAAAAIGDGFSFAEQTDPDTGISAPAFPSGPDARAFWAGVCDLHAGGFAVGTDPGTRYTHCIDHPHGFPDSAGPNLPMPPLAPGLAPDSSLADGWRRTQGAATGGPGWRKDDVRAAGAHPDGSASFWFSRGTDLPLPKYGPDGSPRDVQVSLPPGVVADPTAVPMCPSEAIHHVPSQCPPQTQVGVSTITYGNNTAVFPVYNVEPRAGRVAELLISAVGVDTAYTTNVPIAARVRTEGDFGVDGSATTIPSALSVNGQTITLWGVPWAASHDPYRPVAAYCHNSNTVDADPFGTVAWQATGALSSFGLPGGGTDSGGCNQDPVPYHPSWGPIKPFFAIQTECSDENPVTRIEAANYHTPVVAEEGSVAPLMNGCDDIQFATKAEFGVSATSTRADGPSGLEVELGIEPNDEPPAAKRFNADDDDPESAVAHWKSPAGRSTSHLDQTLLTLPEGVSVNPSGATGLDGCSDEEIGLRQPGDPPLFNNGDPFDGDPSDGAECPQSSIIGQVHEVKSPVLEETLTGQLVLGDPKPGDVGAAGESLRVRLFLVVRNGERGLLAKVAGTTVTDPVTGQLEADFDNNPRVPVERLTLSVRGGERGMLALPQGCGSSDWSSELAPWSGQASALDGGEFVTDFNCENGFGPGLAAGMNTPAARSNGTFSFRFNRPEGDQYLGGLTARLPQGLLASVKEVPLCTDGQAANGSCPAGSRIGTVDAKAGSGDPFVLEQKGEVFLTEGYKGGEYGLAVKVRVIAGPFRGASELQPIVVRQAIHVDRRTAQVTAISDLFPTIRHGIPLRVREITVNVDRDSFMLNPSGCEAKQVGADIVSVAGTTATRSVRFQASGCARLLFKPKLTLALSGRKQTTTGKHPGIKAKVTQTGIGEAGIEKAVVRLPKSLALDPDNAQALCEFEDGTRDDLESHCPKGSIVGRARAVSPLLNDPLVGNVYFVKNVRKDPTTGNLIRTLPMIIVALRGEIAVNLRGESSTTKNGRLVNTFNDVPDAPVRRFNLNINGGKNGILAVTRTRRAKINLCDKPRRHVAEADMDGHNGKRHDRNIKMKTPCKAKKSKKAIGRKGARAR